MNAINHITPYRSLDAAVLCTLLYADIFDTPLRPSEIHRFLLSFRCPRCEVVQSCIRLANQSIISFINGYCTLSGREKTVGLRTNRAYISSEKLHLITRVLFLFRLIPFIQLLAVTGTVAVGAADQDADIDLLVITTPRRMFLTRTLCLLIATLLGRRRYPNSVTVSDTFCFNFFMTRDHLSCDQQNIYIAHELFQLLPLINRNATYEAFLHANSWAFSYLPNFTIHTSPHLLTSYMFPHQLLIALTFLFEFFNRLYRLIISITLLPLFFSFIDRILQQLQFAYMRTRKTTEDVSSSRLKFHPDDFTPYVLEEYHRRLSAYSRILKRL